MTTEEKDKLMLKLGCIIGAISGSFCPLLVEGLLQKYLLTALVSLLLLWGASFLVSRIPPVDENVDKVSDKDERP